MILDYFLSYPIAFFLLFVFYLHRFGSYFFIDHAHSLARRCRVCYWKDENYKKAFVCGEEAKRERAEAWIWFSLLAFNSIKFWIVNHKRYVTIHTIHNVSDISLHFVSKRYWIVSNRTIRIVNRMILTSLFASLNEE
jgi:hypothetical protein